MFLAWESCDFAARRNGKLTSLSLSTCIAILPRRVHAPSRFDATKLWAKMRLNWKGYIYQVHCLVFYERQYMINAHNLKNKLGIRLYFPGKAIARLHQPANYNIIMSHVLDLVCKYSTDCDCEGYFARVQKKKLALFMETLLCLMRSLRQKKTSELCWKMKKIVVYSYQNSNTNDVSNT